MPSNKSNGHLEFIGDNEYFTVGDSVASAHCMLPVMPDGKRCGRFECYMEAWPDHAKYLRHNYLAYREKEMSGL